MDKPDFVFENHGSIWLVRPQNDDAREHLTDHVNAEATWFGGALAVEPRYVGPLCDVLLADGFEVAHA